MFDFWPYLPLSLAPVLLLVISPHAREGTRVAFAAVLGGSALACVALAIRDATTERTLLVKNHFFDPSQGAPVTFVMETVTAAGWQWPLVAALLLGLPAWSLFRRRSWQTGSPAPVRFACLLSLWWFAGRLALEKTAAPAELIGATGVTIPTLLILPFFGRWAGTRAMTTAGFIAALFWLALVQRSVVVGWSLLATTFNLGTHLDMTAIEQITMPMLGSHDFSGDDPALAQWFWTGLAPQFLGWIFPTVLAGLALGGLPFRATRRGNYRNFSTNIRR